MRKNKKMIEQAIKTIDSLGEYGVIGIDTGPFGKFCGYLRIEKNIFRGTFSVGWNFNYGCARQGETFQTAAEVVDFLVKNDISLYSVKVKTNPDLTNGL